MDLSLIGLKDVLFLLGALLGFASAFIIPPRGRRELRGGSTVLSMGLAIVALGVILLLLTLISESDLRWWINSVGLLALGGVVIYGWRASRSTAPTPVVARVAPGAAVTPATPTPPPQDTKGAVKVACPSCGSIITVEAGATWIKCPVCGLEGKMGG